jgi:hypothetical protein
MDKRLLWMSVLFFVAFVFFAAYVFFNGPINRITRAAEDTTPSLQQSLLFAWPLTVEANGAAETEVTIFVRNNDNKALEEQLVKIATSLGSVSEGQVVTDADGKAIFHVSSDAVGVAQIEAFVDNRRLLRNITVQFE